MLLHSRNGSRTRGRTTEIGRTGKIPIYLVCFHSRRHKTLRGSQQYLVVEQAIRNGDWPYDNGDDPSFFVARRGGLLTWGVCRQPLRNQIKPDTIVIFFSYTPISGGKVLYRLCAIATVENKLDHRAPHRRAQFRKFLHLYTNGLIRPAKERWVHCEDDRPSPTQHHDWLWRIADHRGMTKPQFTKKYSPIYQADCFPDAAIRNGHLRLARNYVIFSALADKTFICPNPPRVAVATDGKSEVWLDMRLQSMTVGEAARRGGRNHLRIVNPSRRYPHPPIHFQMRIEDAEAWRAALIAALKGRKHTGLIMEAEPAKRSRC